ncbi:MAG TPA: aminotransferase class V-fold PLP-dependent enzyme [Candidatus Thermoplasmatota archaeon]|nr:aminotransferase class V-fold PLP-dependent enzyme [Candidatus Thermoplasmatota archaeon]
MDVEKVRAQFPILRERVPGRDGGTHPLRFFDHAASTHAPAPVVQKLVEFLTTSYANVHRGAHHLSDRATDAFEHARERTKAFVRAPSDRESVFVMNTTQALSLASHVACARHDGPVLSTRLEHHSNLLPHASHGDAGEVKFNEAHPWYGRVEMIGVTDDGRIDLDKLEARLRERPRPRLLALSCASNVTGVKSPMRELLEHAQDARVPVLFDGAQILAHERLDFSRLPGGGPEFFAAAGHKAYAPMGSAFLVARRDLLDGAPPWMPGGGTVKLVLDDEIIWADSPDRHEGGTPNVPGAVALGAALDFLDDIGLEEAEAREMRLFDRMLEGFAAIPGVRILGPKTAADRVGVCSFAIDGWSPAALATALNAEAGVAVRHGCFCAHPYFFQLLGLKAGAFIEEVRRGASTSGPGVPGAVRASLGVYNDEADVRALVEAVAQIAARPGDSGYAWKGDTETWESVPFQAGR